MQACDWWNNVRCNQSEKYYPTNQVTSTLPPRKYLPSKSIQIPNKNRKPFKNFKQNQILTNVIDNQLNYDSFYSETKSTQYLPPTQATRPPPTPSVTPPSNQFILPQSQPGYNYYPGGSGNGYPSPGPVSIGK